MHVQFIRFALCAVRRPAPSTGVRYQTPSAIPHFISLTSSAGYPGNLSHFIVWNEVASNSWLNLNGAPDGSQAGRIATYAEMMQRAYRAFAPTKPLQQGGVMLYASIDSAWDAAAVTRDNGGTIIFPNHIGSKNLLNGLWSKLGLSIDWSVAVHPYEWPMRVGDNAVYKFTDN